MARRLPPALRSAAARAINIPLPIRSGVNAGMRWSLGAAGRGFMRGTFEHARVEAIAGLLREGDVVWDVGAHQGYLTLAAARAVGTRGRVLAFEPSPANGFFLRQHVRWNGLANVTVHGCALAGEDGARRFGGSGSSVSFRFGAGDALVTARSIHSLVQEDGCPQPTVLKIDTEGAEAEILRGAGPVLRGVRAVFVSLHGRDLYEQCAGLLTEAGLSLFPSRALAVALERPRESPWGVDKELLAFRGDRLPPGGAVARLF